MSPDELDEHDLPAEIECGDQPVVSAGNLKAGAVAIAFPWWEQEIWSGDRDGTSVPSFTAFDHAFIRPACIEACDRLVAERARLHEAGRS
jgi:hypothetical protein